MTKRAQLLQLEFNVKLVFYRGILTRLTEQVFQVLPANCIRELIILLVSNLGASSYIHLSLLTLDT